MTERRYAKVVCKRHKYETAAVLDEGVAISAARMHALLPCSEVRVIGRDGRDIHWQEGLHE